MAQNVENAQFCTSATDNELPVITDVKDVPETALEELSNGLGDDE